ncbi:MAG TPA: Ku protein [Gemmatimonadota bacterium]|nr:Ku protein [Gemmatimonadota bacterium]
MAARPISSTTISFGLVTVPVKLYATGQSGARISFNMIHEPCNARVKQQWVCTKCEEVVERDETVKGYEFAKDQYVLFSPEELDAIETPTTEGIEISEFVEAPDVDPVWFDRAYYLGPDKGGARAYKLFSEALRDTNRVAIGQYAARGKMYLVMVRPIEGGLVMEQLRYAEEVRPFSEVPVDDVELKKAELQLATQLIEQTSTESFEPTKYRDEVRDQMLSMIEKKVEGEAIQLAPSERAEPQIIDLMAALKASLQKGDKKPAARDEKAAKKSKKSATKKTSKKAEEPPAKKRAASR